MTLNGWQMDSKWYGDYSGTIKLYRCKCLSCGQIKLRSKNQMKRASRGPGKGCSSCSRSLPGNQAAINTAWSHFIVSVKRRNMHCSLTKEQWEELSTSNCYYCGKKPATITKATGSGAIFERNGIDRVSNDIGYVPDNCVPCCQQCNYAKRSGTYSEFIEMCNRVARLHPR